MLLARARQAGVDRVITVGSGIDSGRASLAIAERESGVFAALGIHPHQAGGPEAERLVELAELLRHERAVAVGETGLDFYRDWAPHDRQREASFSPSPSGHTRSRCCHLRVSHPA